MSAIISADAWRVLSNTSIMPVYILHPDAVAWAQELEQHKPPLVITLTVPEGMRVVYRLLNKEPPLLIVAITPEGRRYLELTRPTLMVFDEYPPEAAS